MLWPGVSITEGSQVGSPRRQETRLPLEKGLAHRLNPPLCSETFEEGSVTEATYLDFTPVSVGWIQCPSSSSAVVVLTVSG